MHNLENSYMPALPQTTVYSNVPYTPSSPPYNTPYKYKPNQTTHPQNYTHITLTQNGQLLTYILK
jgi:hypothetical protein